MSLQTAKPSPLTCLAIFTPCLSQAAKRQTSPAVWRGKCSLVSLRTALALPSHQTVQAEIISGRWMLMAKTKSKSLKRAFASPITQHGLPMVNSLQRVSISQHHALSASAKSGSITKAAARACSSSKNRPKRIRKNSASQCSPLMEIISTTART